MSCSLGSKSLGSYPSFHVLYILSRGAFWMYSGWYDCIAEISGDCMRGQVEGKRKTMYILQYTCLVMLRVYAYLAVFGID
jgi:hypothetical protein